MTESEMGTLVQLLQLHTALGRVGQEELKNALRAAEQLGYVIKAPASK